MDKGNGNSSPAGAATAAATSCSLKGLQHEGGGTSEVVTPLIDRHFRPFLLATESTYSTVKAIENYICINNSHRLLSQHRRYNAARRISATIQTIELCK